MSTQRKPRILIIGAGSMGVVAGYHLGLGGADITFLIRPHRRADLDRPQILYSHDDNQLREFTGFSYITSPSEVTGAGYDYILVTLDGAALQSDSARSMVVQLGEAVHGTDTKIVLGTVFFGLRNWFLRITGLPSNQVTSAYAQIHSYPTHALTLPGDSSTDPELLAQADIAYADRFGPGMIVDDSAPEVANSFTEIYNASGVSSCIVAPAGQLAVNSNPMLAVLAACELVDWVPLKDLHQHTEVWDLALAAVREIQALGYHGELGRQAAAETTDATLTASLAAWENAMLPLDLQAFNRYHHGGKVNAQDQAHLMACIAAGEAEGKPMAALRELVQRTKDRHTVTGR
ncbi:ketopantoate reductase family protein [Streptomyces sp. NPDC002574]|uniref:ketopantoate reductase family protein n=1 Tax=Streptomyces sp. NPDC002574 TaxID=3364652 RepID=UPI0036BC975F